MKIAVLGSKGSIGSRHATNIRALGHEVLEYDNPGFDPMIADRMRNIVIETSDAVVIATPSKCHYHDLIESMGREKPTFVEKPIATDENAWRDLQNYHSTKNVFVGCNLRFHPCVQQVKQWLAAGDIGVPLWASFTCATKAEKYTEDGVVLNTGAHEVDLALYFFGPAICEIAVAEAEEASFTLKHSNGVRSVFFLSLATPNRVREFWIAGAEKNIGVDLDARRMSLGEKVIQAPGSYDDDYVNELRGFVDRINGRFAPGATGHDGLAALRVLLDVKKKAGIS